MKIKLLFLVLILAFYLKAQAKPQLRYQDKVRIKEAMDISAKFGDKLWKGYSAVPFALVLVTDSAEFLINHPDPSPDFQLLGEDDILKTKVYYRKPQFSPQFLATFPAVNELSCIVVGTPENTNKNSTEWIITLLHEHFHQYQNAHPDYFRQVNKLDLARGDQTGMWMLNYPFPYDSLPVIQQYEAYANALHQAASAIQSKAFEDKLVHYIVERKKLQVLLSEDDYKYFSFQLWQEGLARYTEYKYLALLSNYQPSEEVVALPDYVPFNKLREKMYQEEMAKLRERKLNQSKRVCFYSVGFAEGLVLDRVNKNWRDSYLKQMFFIEKYANKYQ